MLQCTLEREMALKSSIKVAALAAVIGLVPPSASAQITIPTVTIGNPGNAPDPFTGNLYGAVPYVYNIGQTEVTNAQYAAFLNAKAASDPFNLYNPNMGVAPYGGITRSGSAGSYIYSTVTGLANNPVNWVSFWDACRFANWLHNGQGNGDTETGAYTLTAAGISANSIPRNSEWQWAVSSDDEWYKAAYYQPASQGGDSDNYWLYPTQSNEITTARANYGGATGAITSVGMYDENFYGAFDLGGNVWEWNESVIHLSIGSLRGARGGSFESDEFSLGADFRLFISPPSFENAYFGFRVSRVSGVSCPADVSNDGAVDSDDIIAFFAAWDANDIAADFNGDAGVDGDDVIGFFGAWDNGC